MFLSAAVPHQSSNKLVLPQRQNLPKTNFLPFLFGNCHHYRSDQRFQACLRCAMMKERSSSCDVHKHQVTDQRGQECMSVNLFDSFIFLLSD